MQVTKNRIDDKTELIKHLGLTILRVDNLDLEKLKVYCNQFGIKIEYGRFNFVFMPQTNDNNKFCEMSFSNSYNCNWDNNMDFAISQTKMFLAFQEGLEKIENILIEYLKKI